ncbi:MAG: ABC transporter substrate-binding protein [Bacteroidota bacterium]
MSTEVRVGGVPEHFNLPWKLANEYGLFEKDDINFQWQFYSAGTGAMVKALADDELDMAVLLTEGAVSAIIKGLKARIVKQYIASPLIWGIHTGCDSGLENIGQCEGKKYAISRFGSGSHLMAMIDAEIRGKKIEESDFVLIENMQGALPSLQNNQSQVFFWEKYTTKPLVDKGMLERIGEFITPWSCFQIVATEKALATKRGAIEKILASMNFICKQFMRADNSIDMVLEHFEMKPEDAHSWFYSTEWNTDYHISEKMLENVMYSLKKIGNISSEVKPEVLVDEVVELV